MMKQATFRIVLSLAALGLVASGCSRTKLSEFGDPKLWQLEFPCADNRYTESAANFTLESRPLTGLGNTWESPCGPDVVESGPDETILWESPAQGVYRVTATMDGSQVGLFVLRDGCDAEVPACDVGAGTAEVLVDVVSGESLLFVVDAVTPDDAGVYRLQVERVSSDAPRDPEPETETEDIAPVGDGGGPGGPGGQ